MNHLTLLVLFFFGSFFFSPKRKRNKNYFAYSIPINLLAHPLGNMRMRMFIRL